MSVVSVGLSTSEARPATEPLSELERAGAEIAANGQAFARSLTFEAGRETSVAEVNAAVEKAADGRYLLATVGTERFRVQHRGRSREPAPGTGPRR